MTWKIKDKTNGHIIDVTQKPTIVQGVWECGSARFTDPTGDMFEPLLNEYNTSPTVPEFWMLFTSSERIAIKASKDPVIDDFVATIGDPRLANINLADPNMQEALDAMVTQGLVTAERMETVKLGVPIP